MDEKYEGYILQHGPCYYWTGHTWLADLRFAKNYATLLDAIMEKPKAQASVAFGIVQIKTLKEVLGK